MCAWWGGGGGNWRKPLTIPSHSYVIRRRLTLPPEEALFLFVNGVLPASTMLLREVYGAHRDADGCVVVRDVEGVCRAAVSSIRGVRDAALTVMPFPRTLFSFLYFTYRCVGVVRDG